MFSESLISVSFAAFLFLTQVAAAQTSDANSMSMNPAARGYVKHQRAPGTAIPNATGTNPYTGKSVGEPLQPNDLGSTEQRSKEQ